MKIRFERRLRSDASIAEAVVSFADAHVSGLPVVDRTGRVIGVVSTTDVLTAEAEVEAPSEDACS